MLHPRLPPCHGNQLGPPGLMVPPSHRRAVASRYSNNRPLCPRITHSFLWRGGQFAFLCCPCIRESVRPGAVMSARLLPPQFLACSRSVLMPHQVVMAFQLLWHSFPDVLQGFFFFIPSAHYQCCKKHGEYLKSSEVHSRPGML